METLRAELHVHTVLSPCAEVEMIPPLIVQEALERNIRLIAITDHNASANTAAVMRAAEGTGLHVLPGMELQTVEEVHLLCLFDELEQVEKWQMLVDQRLPAIPNNPEYFGEQFIVDETGDFLGREERLLITSTSFRLEQAVQQVISLGGIVIPAHVDRKAFGLLANLGFVPPDVPVSALEISRHLPADRAAVIDPRISGYTLLQGGDAHRLDELLGANEFTVESPNLSELRLALLGAGGRRVRIWFG